MTINDLNSFNNILDVCKGSIQHRIFTVKEALRSQSDVDTNAFQFLLWMRSSVIGDTQTITISEDDGTGIYQYLIDIFPTDNTWVKGTTRDILVAYSSAISAIHARYEVSDPSSNYWAIYISGDNASVTLATVDRSESGKILINIEDSSNYWKGYIERQHLDSDPLTSAVENVSCGIGLFNSYYEVVSTAYDHCLDDSQMFYNAISDKVDELELLEQDQVNVELKSAAQNGPISLVSKVASLFDGYRQKAVDEQAAGYDYFRDPTISLQTMSYGVIMGNIGNILTVVGMVSSVFSRILGIITAGVGLVISGVTKMIINYTTQIDKTHFTLENIKGEHCFNFCVNQYIIDAANCYYVREAMKLMDTNVITIKSSACPVVSMVFYDEATDKCWVEEHLSTDFHFSKDVSRFNYNKVYPSGYVTNNTKYALDIFTSNDGWLSMFNYNVVPANQTGNNGMSMPLWFENITPDINVKRIVHDLSSTWYDPIGSDMLYTVSKMTSLDDETNQVITERLYTAVFLYCLYQLRCLIDQVRQNYTTYEDDLYNKDTLEVSHWSTFFVRQVDDNCISDYLLCLCKMMKFSMYYFLTIDSTKPSNYSISIGSLTNDMSVEIKKCFDGLTLVKDVQSAIDNNVTTLFEDLLVWVAIDQNHVEGKFFTTYRIPASSWRSSNQNLYFIDDHGLFSDDYDVSVYIQPFSYPGWNKSALIDLPTVTMTSVVLGLVFDGLSLIIATTLVVTAANIKRKINNKRARAQSKAENSWYKYGQMANDPNVSQEELDAQWKVYKSDRFNTNAWATLSGYSTLQLGYYDNKEEKSSMLDTIRKAISTGGSDDVDVYSLKYIAQLIKNV
jgi:hypothetical protein